MRRGVLLIWLAACGRVGFDGARSDGRVDGAGDCWNAWRAGPLSLTTPQPVAELNTDAAEGDPALSADELTLYFARANPVANDLFVATRPDRLSPFGPASLLADLNTSRDETKLALSSDGLRAIWSSDRTGSLGHDLWEAARTTPADAFQGATQAPFTQINDSDDQFDPYLSSDGLRLYFAPSQATSQVVQVSTRATPADSFGAGADVADLGTSFHADPTLSPDELVIVYSASLGGEGTLTIWYATRTAKTAAFSDARPVPGINPGSDYHQDPLLSSDGCELFFSNHATPTNDLYVALVL